MGDGGPITTGGITEELLAVQRVTGKSLGVTGESLRVIGGHWGVTRGYLWSLGVTGGSLEELWGTIWKKLTKCHLNIPKKARCISTRTTVSRA